MQEILVRLQYSVEDGSKTDGGQVYHEEGKQPSSQSNLVCIEVTEKCYQVISIEIGNQHQREKQYTLERTQESEQTYRAVLFIATQQGGESRDQGGVDSPFGKKLAKVVGNVEGEVYNIRNRSGPEHRAEHPCLDDSQ